MTTTKVFVSVELIEGKTQRHQVSLFSINFCHRLLSNWSFLGVKLSLLMSDLFKKFKNLTITR